MAKSERTVMNLKQQANVKNRRRQEIVDFLRERDTGLRIRRGLQRQELPTHCRSKTHFYELIKRSGVNTEGLKEYARELAMEEAEGLERLKKLHTELPKGDFVTRATASDLRAKVFPSASGVLRPN